MELPQTDNYLSLFLNDTPLLDVRAPVEFSQGAFPHAENFPLINDQERADIGLRYKQQGQDAAVKLGHTLVQGEVKSQRVDNWQNFFKQNPEGALYCFRGGMRSKISQQWLYEHTGVIYPRVKGGYKALRRFLLEALATSASQIQPLVLGGRTGCGKTLFLKKLKQQVDLEGIYHHRGSVFGKHVTAQPSQIDIENRLSIELLQHINQQRLQLVFEDEGTNIGSRNIPEVLYSRMKQAPVVLLETSTEQRVEITFQEYIIEALSEHQAFYGDSEGYNLWSEQLVSCIDRIQRRLGGQRHQQLRKLVTDAISQQSRNGDTSLHKKWISILLVDYYDPMYDYQLCKKQHRIIYKGQPEEVLAYLKESHQIS